MSAASPGYLLSHASRFTFANTCLLHGEFSCSSLCIAAAWRSPGTGFSVRRRNKNKRRTRGGRADAEKEAEEAPRPDRCYAGEINSKAPRDAVVSSILIYPSAYRPTYRPWYAFHGNFFILSPSSERRMMHREPPKCQRSFANHFAENEASVRAKLMCIAPFRIYISRKYI